MLTRQVPKCTEPPPQTLIKSFKVIPNLDSPILPFYFWFLFLSFLSCMNMTYVYAYILVCVCV